MSAFAIFLLFLSTIAHASWNLFGKKAADAGISFYLIAVLVSALIYSPILMLTADWFYLLPKQYWTLVCLAGIAETVYMIGLSGAYQFGSLGLSYPIARALPVLLVPLGSFILFHERLEPLAMLGILLIVLGMFGLLRFDGVSSNKKYMIGFAMLSAFGTMAYSIIDYQALKIAQQYLPSQQKWQISLFYAACQGMATIPFLGLILLAPTQRQKLKQAIVQQGKVAAMAGVVMTGTYALVLFSYMFVTHVSYAVAFRQLSIPIGVLLGVIFLKEHVSIRMGIANLVLLAGLILVVI